MTNSTAPNMRLMHAPYPLVFRPAGSLRSATPHEVDDLHHDRNNHEDADDPDPSDSRQHRASCPSSLVRPGPRLGRAPVPPLLDALLARGRALDVLDGCRAPPAAGHQNRDPDHQDDDPHDEQDP